MVLILISGSAVLTASVASVTATPGRVRALQDLRLGGPPSVSDSPLGLSVRERHDRVGASSVRSTSAATTVTVADGAETFDERGPNFFL